MSPALLLGMLHAVVDAATVTVVFRVTGAVPLTAVVAWVLAYDVLAFGLQPLIGWVQDRWASPRTGMVAGVGLTAASVGCAHGVDAGTPAVVLAVVLAGMGNAAFHLGAGACVLRGDMHHATPAGLFVGPGALGLGLGVWYGGTPSAGPLWLVLLPVLLALPVVVRTEVPDPTAAVAGIPRPAREACIGAMGLLLLSIAIRALVGGTAGRGYSGTWLLLGIPVVAFAGKVLGGVLADRYGWTRTSVTALVLSAPLLALTWPHPIVLLAGMLVFQLTMPVTLVAVVRLVPTRIATGFGLTCLALVLGALGPTTVWGYHLGHRPLLAGWVLLAAVAVWAGLTLAGVPGKASVDRAPAPTVTRR